MKSVPINYGTLIRKAKHKRKEKCAEGRKIKCTEHVQKEQNITGTMKREPQKDNASNRASRKLL
jgi:hypothetical protein